MWNELNSFRNFQSHSFGLWNTMEKSDSLSWSNREINKVNKFQQDKSSVIWGWDFFPPNTNKNIVFSPNKCIGTESRYLFMEKYFRLKRMHGTLTLIALTGRWVFKKKKYISNIMNFHFSFFFCFYQGKQIWSSPQQEFPLVNIITFPAFNLAATADTQGTIKLWHGTTGEELSTFSVSSISCYMVAYTIKNNPFLMVRSTLDELIAILKEAFFWLPNTYKIGHFKVACLPVAAVSVWNQYHPLVCP